MGDKKSIFGILPIRLLLDKRLKLNDLRVFAALSSFQGTKGNCFPSLEKLAERSGVDKSHLSKHTSRLVQFGYLKKTRRGKRISNVYEILSESAKGANSPESESAERAESDKAASAESESAGTAESNTKTTMKTKLETPPTGEEVKFECKYLVVTKSKLEELKKAYPKIREFYPLLIKFRDMLDEKTARGESIGSAWAILHNQLKRENEGAKLSPYSKRSDPQRRSGTTQSIADILAGLSDKIALKEN